MEACTKVGGKTTRLAAMADLSTLTEMYMTASGIKTWLMGTVFSSILMEPNTRGTGKMTNSTATDSRLGQMGPNTKGAIPRARSTALGASRGVMAAPITANLWKTTFRDRANTTGLTVVNSMVAGSTIKWRAEEFSPGPMEEGTKETISMIRRRDRVSSPGQMAESTREDGKTASSTEWASTRLPEKTSPGKENGKTASVFSGYPFSMK